jgi:SAM-dependent methyltransferase
MPANLDIDVETLKCEIKKTYAPVSAEPETEFIFPTGRAWALYLGYPPDLLARVGGEGSVTGVDMTPEMIAKARASYTNLGVRNVEFIESEAEQLPFADGSFDVVISKLPELCWKRSTQASSSSTGSSESKPAISSTPTPAQPSRTRAARPRSSALAAPP